VPDARLVPCLVDLRGEFNELSPGRDRDSDGWIADEDHESSSKHQPNADGWVRAIDVDDTGPWPNGMTFDGGIETLRKRHQLGQDARLQNIIFNRRITSRSWGWTWKNYTGRSAHTEHAHLEAVDKPSVWNRRGPWGLLARFGDDMDYDTFRDYLRKAVTEDATLRRELARAVIVTDNVVNLADLDGKPDAGLQSLIQWPALGYAKKASEQAADANAGVVALRNTVNQLTVSVGKLVEQLVPPPATPAAATPAKATGAKAPKSS
jgi:hypothetical protein